MRVSWLIACLLVGAPAYADRVDWSQYVEPPGAKPMPVASKADPPGVKPAAKKPAAKKPAPTAKKPAPAKKPAAARRRQ